MIDFELLKKIILEKNSFLLTTHVNPDADAIGSEVALYFILKELGKEVYIINHSLTPYNLEFLDPDNKIEKFDVQKHSPLFNQVDVLVALDFNRSNRIVSMHDNFKNSDKLKICIDHHQDPENFVNYFFVDPEYCATGQIIYDLIKKTSIVNLNYQTAYPIYAAIMTDTGSFRFERTTPEIHGIAAELLQHDVKPNEVFDKLYDQSKFSKIKLLGKALDSMQLYGDKKQIGYMKISQEDFAITNAVESDTENFVNFSLSVEGVKIGLLFIELNEGFKVSFRSKGTIPVNKLAAEFGGGGHINAAGARVFNHNLSELLPEILKKTEGYLDK
ncbi:MAG: DHH family phosphoesterase [Ignavibacteriaceae bacterium]